MLPISPSEKPRRRQMREILAIFVGRVPHRNFMQTRYQPWRNWIVPGKKLQRINLQIGSTDCQRDWFSPTSKITTADCFAHGGPDRAFGLFYWRGSVECLAWPVPFDCAVLRHVR